MGVRFPLPAPKHSEHPALNGEARIQATMMTRIRKAILRLRSAIGLALVTCSAASWAGTVVVDFALEAQVERRIDGALRGGEVIAAPPAPKALSPFGSVTYRNERLEWRFATGLAGFGGILKNLSHEEICLGFDEATVSSNFRPSPQALRAYEVIVLVGRDLKRAGGSDPARTREHFTAPAICIPAGQVGNLSISAELSGLFPNGSMFNVAVVQGKPELNEKGVGNWFRLSVPVGYGTKGEALDVMLKANDSRARISHF
jgi:hypothetical protein